MKNPLLKKELKLLSIGALAFLIGAAAIVAAEITESICGNGTVIDVAKVTGGIIAMIGIGIVATKYIVFVGIVNRMIGASAALEAAGGHKADTDAKADACPCINDNDAIEGSDDVP